MIRINVSNLVDVSKPVHIKKLEALRKDVKDYVHFVITFEELMGMFVAKGIELSEILVSKEIQDAFSLGLGYAIAGGVASLNRVRKAVIEFKNQAIYKSPLDNEIIDETLRSK